MRSKAPRRRQSCVVGRLNAKTGPIPPKSAGSPALRCKVQQKYGVQYLLLKIRAHRNFHGLRVVCLELPGFQSIGSETRVKMSIYDDHVEPIVWQLS